MTTKGGNGLRKAERMVSEKDIAALFESEDRRVAKAYPLMAVYRRTARETTAATTPVQIMLSVPKRKLKHAVDRNRVKRQLREAYRHHKTMVWPEADDTATALHIAFVWQSSELCDSATVDSMMKRVLGRVARPERK